MFVRASISEMIAMHSNGSLYREIGSAQQSPNCLTVVARSLQLDRKCVRLSQDNPKTVLRLLFSRAILLRRSENIPATFSRMVCNNLANFHPIFDHIGEIISRMSWECRKITWRHFILTTLLSWKMFANSRFVVRKQSQQFATNFGSWDTTVILYSEFRMCKNRGRILAKNKSQTCLTPSDQWIIAYKYIGQSYGPTWC